MQNFVNLELKFFCKDFAPVRKTLKKIKATKVGTISQKDYFFNLPHEESGVPKRLKLRIEGNKLVLVYYQRPKFSKDKSTPSQIALFPVEDEKILDFLTSALGVKAIVEKKRELWKKDNALFNLDEVKKVGKIFEIEVKTDKRHTKSEEKKFIGYKKLFLPFLDSLIEGSNVDLVLKNR